MDMLHIPPAQPKASPKPSQNSKAADKPDRSFSKVLDTTQNSDETTGAEETATPSATVESAESEETKQIKAQKGRQKEPTEEAKPSAEEEAEAEPLVCLAAGIENQKLEPARPNLENTTADNAKTVRDTATTQASQKPGVSLPAETLPKEAGTETVATEKISDPSQTQGTSPAKPAPMAETIHKNAANRAQTSMAPEVAAPETQPAVEKNPPQAVVSGSEAVTKGGLMENSLGSLVQEVRPLRNDLRGRQTANQNREDISPFALSKQGSEKIASGVQNENSLGAFTSEGKAGFSAIVTEGAAKGADTMAGNTTFDTMLDNGMHTGLANQQTNQPLQTPAVTPQSIPLANGGHLTENQVVNQVLEGLSFEKNGDQSRIVIKMNPEELGEVKLSLTIEKDQLRAQLLTQNQQVQEILEKHLPKLHEALGKQGLKLEDIQVGVDSNPHSGHESFANHRRPDSFRRMFNDPAVGLGDTPLPTVAAAARMTSAEGISLRI